MQDHVRARYVQFFVAASQAHIAFEMRPRRRRDQSLAPRRGSYLEAVGGYFERSWCQYGELLGQHVVSKTAEGGLRWPMVAR